MKTFQKVPRHLRFLPAVVRKLSARQKSLPHTVAFPEEKRRISLVIPGKRTAKFVGTVRGKDPKTKILYIVKKISKIPIIATTNKVLIEKYANRTAEEILQSKVILQAKNERGNLAIHGCVDHTHLLIACLKVMHIPATFVRWANHSMAKITLNGKNYFVDVERAQLKDASPLRLISGAEEEALKLLKEKNLYKEGRDAHDLGLDYHHFEHAHIMEEK